MSDTYVSYLEAKVEELEAQVRLAMGSVYHRESRIRTLLYQTRYLDDQLRIAKSLRCGCEPVSACTSS